MEYKSLSKLFYSDEENYKKIYEERFNANNTIHFDFNISGKPAFVVINLDINSMMLSIYKKDKIISQLCNLLPGKALEQFAQRCLIDEIIISNNIEGIHSSRKEINDVLTDIDKSNNNKRFKGLVQKYVMLQQEEILNFKTCEDIRALYDELVYVEIEEDDPDNLPDGKLFRKSSTSVVTATQKEIHRGITPESKIIQYMSNALDMLNNESLELLLRISIFHYLFGYIHPFYDGNGRTSRFISSYLLSRNFETILGYRLSYTIKENIKHYYDAFTICNDPHNLGELTQFVMMFIGIIDESMTQLINALQKRYELLKKYESAISLLPMGENDKYSTLYFYLIQASLFADPKSGISMNDLTHLMGLSNVTIRNRLNKIGDNLLKTNKHDKAFFYSLNLKAVDKIVFEM